MGHSELVIVKKECRAAPEVPRELPPGAARRSPTDSRLKFDSLHNLPACTRPLAFHTLAGGAGRWWY